MGFHGLANTEIVLELRLNSTSSMPEKTMEPAKKPSPSSNSPLEPSLTLALSSDSCGGAGTVGSSVSNASVKREREVVSEESERGLENTTSGEDGDQEYEDGGVNARKKLRLTKVQSGLLEKAFNLHTTLNLQKQKLELARDLKLRPRQVEVWFQNRRARTKLKQTEVDCEYLKKCCKTLTDENQRLRQEVQALKAQKVSHHANPAAKYCTCRCQRPTSPCVRTSLDERIGITTSANSTKSPFTMAAAAAKPHLFNPFTSSSAAC